MLSSPRRLVILFSVDSGRQATSPNVCEYRNTIINIAGKSSQDASWKVSLRIHFTSDLIQRNGDSVKKPLMWISRNRKRVVSQEYFVNEKCGTGMNSCRKGYNPRSANSVPQSLPQGCKHWRFPALQIIYRSQINYKHSLPIPEPIPSAIAVIRTSTFYRASSSP